MITFTAVVAVTLLIFGTGWFDEVERVYPLYIYIVIVVSLLAWLGYSLRAYYHFREIFNDELNAMVFRKIMSTFNMAGAVSRPALYGPKESALDRDLSWSRRFDALVGMLPISEEYKDTVALLDNSELITEPRNNVKIDNRFDIRFEGRDMQFVEFDIEHITHSGKSTSTKQIFFGYFVSLELKNSLAGKTFISTEGDKSGFGHRSFWNNLINNSLEVTELEWNDFEDMLHVATTNPTEARYVLTPDFMADLYDWWSIQHGNGGGTGNIRVSFIGSRLYMLLPHGNAGFNKTTTSLDSYEMQEYMMTIATPLMHVLHLAEDVKT